jgi:hypothetical protein
MLIIYIITIIILTVLVFFGDYQINQNTIVSALIKSFLFILCSISIAYLILYLRGDIFSIPRNNNNNKIKDSDNKDNKFDYKNAQKNLLKVIQTTTDTIPGELNQNLQKDENFFSNFITN